MGGTEHGAESAGCLSEMPTVDEARQRRTPWDLIGPVISAAATGIGLLGFVVFFGGAIMWVQLNEAGLPASEGVAVAPKSVLLVTGAQFLAGALGSALGVVGALWVYNRYLSGRITDRAKRRGEQLHRAAEGADVVVVAAEEALREREAALAQAKSHQQSTATTAAERPDVAVYQDAAGAAAEEVAAAEEELQSAADALKAAEKQAKSERSKIDRLQRFHDRRDAIDHFIALVVPVVLAEAALSVGALPISDYAWLALVAFATLVFMFSVWDETKKNFVWFAVSAFIAIGLFQGVSTYLRTHDSPKVEPMAAITNGPRPVTGYYVAQTSDRIYVGLPAHGTVPARMLALNRDDVKAISIGSLTPVAGAMKVAEQFARDLVARDTPAPVLSAASLTNKRFRVARKGTTRAARKTKRGTMIRFRLSAAAGLKIVITRVVPGLVNASRCVTPTARLRGEHATRCVRAFAIGSLFYAGEAKGTHRISVGGRVGRAYLTRGAYRVALTAGNAGGHSNTVTLGFAVVR